MKELINGMVLIVVGLYLLTLAAFAHLTNDVEFGLVTTGGLMCVAGALLLITVAHK